MTYNFGRKRPVLAALFFCTAFCLLISSCKKPEDDLGVGIQPEEDNINLFSTDTTAMEIVTVNEDSLLTDELSFSLLGNYVDPIFGITRASFYSQIRLSSNNVDFGAPEDLVVDSLVLDLVYGSEYYGSTGNQTFSITEVTEEMSVEANYSSQTNLETNSTNLIEPGWETRNVDPTALQLVGDDSLAILKFHLNETLAQQFFNAGAENLANNDAFTSYFNGLYLQSQTDDGAVANINLRHARSKLTMYYRNVAEEDTLTFDFLLNSESARVNKFEHDYSGTELAPLENGEESIPGDQRLYIQAGSGVKSRLHFPHIDENVQPSNRSINRAELVFPVADTSEAFELPEELLILNSNSVPISRSEYDTLTHEYSLNITLQIQNLLEGNGAQNELYLASAFSGVSVRRVVLNGTATENRRARLVLTYTE